MQPYIWHILAQNLLMILRKHGNLHSLDNKRVTISDKTKHYNYFYRKFTRISVDQ